MNSDHQISIDELLCQEELASIPARIAYIDECGNFGFDFEKEGTSLFYVLTAIVIETSRLDEFHQQFESIKKNNGFKNTELKSSNLKESSRARIISQLLPVDFRIVLFIADKKRIREDTPLRDYKQTFVKNMNNRMHHLLYQAYPKLKIIMDETGYPEFQQSFRTYVANNRRQYNLLNEYDFDFVDSRDEILVQLADLIGGSINKWLINPQSTNYLEMLRGKITAYERFPNKHEPYWGEAKPEDYKYDSAVYTLAVKRAQDYIAKFEKDESDDKKAQVASLRYLLFYVMNISPSRYVYSDELLENIRHNIKRKATKEFLFRRVIAPMRDSGVILASCVHGYKIPISINDVTTYLNQTTSTIGPMLRRMGICRRLILQGTDNDRDICDDEAFVRYKRLFE